MNHVERLLNYMAAFASHGSRSAVAKLMDQIANAPSVGAAVTAIRRGPDEPAGGSVIVATLAYQAVCYVEGTAPKPEWLSQAGI